MAAGPQKHYGPHDYNLGELQNSRVHIYPTLSAANAELQRASARIIYVVSEAAYYFGHPGAWIKASESVQASTGVGISVGQVSDPAELNTKWPDFVATVLSADASTSTITVVASAALDVLVPGDTVVVSGSNDDSGAWLDGSYSALNINTGTGQITVSAGTVPASTGTVTVWGDATFTDETFPVAGSIAVVNPDPDLNEPTIWIFDDTTGAWKHLLNSDPRHIRVDGSREFLAFQALEASLFRRPERMQLVRMGIVSDVLDGTVTSNAPLISVSSTGASTTIVFDTEDDVTIENGVDTVTITGNGPLDGTHPTSFGTVAPGTPNRVSVEIGNFGVNDASPAGVVRLTKPGNALATIAAIASTASDLATHIAAPDPHSQYTTDAEAAAIATPIADDAVATQHTNVTAPAIAQSMSDHEAAIDPHSQYTTDAEAAAAARAAVVTHNANLAAHGGIIAAHNGDLGAHDGAIAQIREFLSHGSGQGVNFSAQVIAPGVPWGTPVCLNAENGVWESRATEDQEPDGLSTGASAYVDQYTNMSVSFTAATKTAVLTGGASLTIGTRVEFIGAAGITGIHRVVNASGAALELFPGPTADGSDTGVSVRVYSADGTVTLVGGFPLRPVKSYISGAQIIGLDPVERQVFLDTNLDGIDLAVGSMLTIGSFGYGQDGTYEIEYANGNGVAIAPVLEPVTLALPITGADASASTISVSADLGPQGVFEGHMAEVAGAGVNDGMYQVTVIDGAVATVTPPLPISSVAGTVTFYNRYGTPFGTQEYPFIDHYIEDAAIVAVVADAGSGLASIQTDGSTDLAVYVPLTDTITLSGLTEAADNGTYEIDSVDGPGNLIYLSVALTADQGAGGTFTTNHDVSGPRGSVDIDGAGDPNDLYDVGFGAKGPMMYANLGGTHDIAKFGRFRLGHQASEGLLLLRIQDEGGGITVLVPGATVDTDASKGNVFELTADQDFTLNNPSSLFPGKTYLWCVIQDATGSRIITLDTNFKTPAAEGVTLSTDPAAVDIITGVVRSDGVTIDTVSVENYS